MKNIWLNLRPLALMMAIVLLILTASRAFLVYIWYARVEQAEALQFVLWGGASVLSWRLWVGAELVEGEVSA